MHYFLGFQLPITTIKAFHIPIKTAIPIDTLNKIVALPFPIAQHMINNYNKSSTSYDKYNERNQLNHRKLNAHGGRFGEYSIFWTSFLYDL
jgi:hypothetical protein